MSFADFLIFSFGCSGITVIIVLSYILEPIRSFLTERSVHLEKLLSCTMCTGFWVGFVCSFWFSINPMFGAAVSSVFSWLISSFVEMTNTISIYLDSYIDDGEDDNDERSVE